MERVQSKENRVQSKNIVSLLKRRLSSKVFNIIRKIGNIAEDNAFSVYIVGGIVRDMLLGVENLDLDIVVEGSALNFVEILKDRIDLDVVTHQRFGTATITLPRGFKIDIASARKEHYSSCAALPTVTLASIKEDLFRRDFTINALAVKVNRTNFGELLDLFDGQKDLRNGKIRVLHDRSFIDDPTRILRAIRFEQRYNFSIEPKTFKLMRRALTLGLLNRLTRFRLGRELILLLKEKRTLKATLRFDQLCGLELIHPLIRLDNMVKKRLKSPKAKDDWLVYFMLLTKELNAQQLEKLCCDFSLTRKDKRRLKTLKTQAKLS